MYDTIYEPRDGLLTRIVDRTGVPWSELWWREDQLDRLVMTHIVVEGAVVNHPLLGPAHIVGNTAVSALDWARPQEIPAMAEPGRLPPGVGVAILNVIAVLARRGGVSRLRYAGPYPTAALWRSLARSFRCAADEATFTADAVERALRVARDPIAIDFVPAPHERIAIAGGFVELRDGLERVVLDGVSYEPDGSPARLVAGTNTGAWHCEIWFGDAPYARVATLTTDGQLRARQPIPASTSAVIGQAFPAALRLAIAELVADTVIAPLAGAARALVTEGALRWADLGGRVAREEPDGFAVHAALWDRIAPLGLGRLALALAEALAPVVTTAVVRRAG
ncbi:MAG: hypothetical protein ABIY55_17790 [Kofleriaceae bacterium]